MTAGSITILGCGGSAGVPILGNYWGACNPDQPKNIRTRASILIQHAGKNIVIDTGPDFRAQLLRHDIRSIDAVLYTHSHADHAHGIDELRPLSVQQRGPIDIYLNQETLSDLSHRFAYAFTPYPNQEIYRKIVTPHVIQSGHVFSCLGLSILPLTQDHGFSTSLGFKIGNMAYSTDVVDFAPHVLETMHKIDLWIVDCGQMTPHKTHAHLDKTLEWIEKVAPKKAILTHMGTTMDYDTLKRTLPSHIAPAFDGMHLSFDG